jgi:hypothetical protein
MMVLRMVEEGKVTPEEGARLLAAIGEREAQAEGVGATVGSGVAAAEGAHPFGAAYEDAGAGTLNGRFFRVRVTNSMTGKQKVDVNIPLTLVDFGLRFVPQNAKMDVQKVRDAIAGGVRGKIVDVMDNEKGDHVEIFVE